MFVFVVGQNALCLLLYFILDLTLYLVIYMATYPADVLMAMQIKMRRTQESFISIRGFTTIT